MFEAVTDIRFYHLQRATLDELLPVLLEKARERGHRIVVKLGSAERVASLDTQLWTYRPESFLAHGTASDGEADRQPIWLTTVDENPNSADMLVLADGATCAKVDGWAVLCDLFDGNDEEAVAAARSRWTAWKTDGHALTYWQQGPRGWEKKAAT
ncbi:DNA polymerase III subunit chi [Roseiterribacter gracilis]|uniref:DNA polymerase III subunit chi n=1 Tax=Roseiterribacter gracilis TaxID=2812848 RepID=A0A8S8XCQ0_9PROT|nr:DNA polymerase III subunit chi [Rhodospirillales bacterium TMPK1]